VHPVVLNYIEKKNSCKLILINSLTSNLDAHSDSLKSKQFKLTSEPQGYIYKPIAQLKIGVE